MAVTLAPEVSFADEACNLAREAAKTKSELEQALALELCGNLETKSDRHSAAADRYAAAAKLARADLSVRKRLLNLRRRASDKAKAKKSTERAKEILAADQVLQQIQRRPRKSGVALEKTLAALRDAEQVYRRDRDPRALEARALSALVRVRSKEKGGVEIAEKVIGRKRVARHARMVAYEALSHAQLEAGVDEAAARAAIHYNHLRNQDLPEEKRPHARAPILDRACQKLGVGLCTRLELKLTGEVTFTDFSRMRKKAVLSDADIERVHAQALPALEACVLDAARLEPELYRGVEIQLSWSIGPDGRATNIELQPKRNQPEIMPCAQARLTRVRYPRVLSQERKNVVIPYHLD